MKNARAGWFPVTVFSWNDIERELSEERNLDLLRRFYHNFFVNYEKLGIAISRILRLEIGVGQALDTQYHLMIGKTPPRADPKDYQGLEYWKGIYFIVNIHERKMETFPVPTFDSDLEQAFMFGRDRHIIVKWLNSIKSIDDLIYGDEEEHTMTISEEEYEVYLKSMRD